MAADLPLHRDFSVAYGRLERIAPGLRRIVARNPSPFTFKGTGTYVVGEGAVAVIDPGPDLPEHVEALLAGLGDERITHILVTHTHRDHSPAARARGGGGRGRRRLGLRPRHRAARRRAGQRAGMGARSGTHPRPHLEP